MPDYENYHTASEFNAGYANSITPDVVEKWETVFRHESADALAEVPCKQNLVYGPAERNHIDFFPAQNGDAPAPVLVAIHGGLWFLFDKWMMHFLAPTFTRRGFHVAAINYPLAPDHTLGEIVTACRSAVAWLWHHAAELHIDRTAISVIGHSAAGQLAAIVAATDWPALDSALPANTIHRLVGVSGFYEIEPFAGTDFQPLVRFAADEYREWNPMTHVRPGMPPALLVTGEKESSLLHQMAAHYAAALQESGNSAELLTPANECHFSVLQAIGQPNNPVAEKVLTFLQERI